MTQSQSQCNHKARTKSCKYLFISISTFRYSLQHFYGRDGVSFSPLECWQGLSMPWHVTRFSSIKWGGESMWWWPWRIQFIILEFFCSRSTVVSTPASRRLKRIRFFSTALECTLWKLPIVRCDIWHWSGFCWDSAFGGKGDEAVTPLAAAVSLRPSIIPLVVGSSLPAMRPRC